MLCFIACFANAGWPRLLIRLDYIYIGMVAFIVFEEVRNMNLTMSSMNQ